MRPQIPGKMERQRPPASDLWSGPVQALSQDQASAARQARKGDPMIYKWGEPITDTELRQMLNGPLSHPLPMFTVSRLVLALADLADADVATADRLRHHCEGREADDTRKAGLS